MSNVYEGLWGLGSPQTKCAGKVSLFDKKWKKNIAWSDPNYKGNIFFFFVCLTNQLRLQIFESFPWPEYTMKLWIFSCQSAHCSCFPRFRVGCCWKDPRGVLDWFDSNFYVALTRTRSIVAGTGKASWWWLFFCLVWKLGCKSFVLAMNLMPEKFGTSTTWKCLLRQVNVMWIEINYTRPRRFIVDQISTNLDVYK